MSGQATGWVLRHGPHPTQLDRHGTPYGARARGLRSVLVAVADAANRDGRHAHPGIENVADAALYGKRQTFNLLAELVAEGWLHVEHPGGGRGLATVYSLPRMGILNGATTASDNGETVQSADGKGATGDHETLHSEAETLQSHVPDQHKRGPNGLATVDSNGRDQRAAGDKLAHDLAVVRTHPTRNPPGFDAFVAVYPRQESIGVARSAWTQATKLATAEDIIAAAERYRDDPNRDPAYTLKPLKWLEAEGWLDVPEPPRPTISKSTRNLAAWAERTSHEPPRDSLVPRMDRGALPGGAAG